MNTNKNLKIWAYAICWNEAKMLPYYLKHYSQFCEKIIIYDNGSNDGSQQIIRNHPKAELRTYDTGGKIKDEVYLQIKNNCWKESRSKADWVIVGDIDEIVYHSDLPKFLDIAGNVHSIFTPGGINMVADKFPTTTGQIYEEVKTGTLHPGSCKPMIFDPNRIIEIAFDPGCHSASKKQITGKMWHWKHNYTTVHQSPIKVLHFKFMGPEYIVSRYRQLGERLSESNKKRGWGFHYLKGKQQIIAEYNAIKNNAQKIT